MEEPITNALEKHGKDITSEFINTNPDFDFHSFLHSVRQEPILEIRLDLTNTNKSDFVILARRAKAFLEATKPQGQKRNASIKCTKEQKTWEYNVFASGVDWTESK
ncbi:MAG: hypothetical protein WC657_01785 [Candidatus Paceibacterota bacterium]|jgi:hypothetical protein